MKVVSVAVAAMVLGVVAASPAQAQNRFKECAAQWNALKEAKQTEGKSYREFQKGCLSTSRSNELSKEAGADDIKMDGAKKKSKSKSTAATKNSPAREAASARRRECAAEWKADKAAGKVADGMKWPQYFSACNTRKKGAAA